MQLESNTQMLGAGLYAGTRTSRITSAVDSSATPSARHLRLEASYPAAVGRMTERTAVGSSHGERRPTRGQEQQEEWGYE